MGRQYGARRDGPGSFADRLTIRETRARYQPKVAHRADADVTMLDRGPHDVAALGPSGDVADSVRPPGRPVHRVIRNRELGAESWPEEELRLVWAPWWPVRILHFPVRSATQFKRRTQIAIFEGMFPDRGRFKRLREHYERPACVVTFDGDIGKASGRSANGFDLGAAVIAARQSGLLVNGGGHSQAAGFTVARDKLSGLSAFLSARAAAHAASDRLVPRMSLDGALAVGAATQDFVSLLARLGPYGVGNPEPRFVFPAVRVVRADIVGEKHVRCLLVDQQGARLGAIAFRAAGSAVGTALVANAGASLHVAARFAPTTMRRR